MNYPTTDLTQYKSIIPPKLTAIPRMHYEPSWPIGNLRLSSESVSMSLYHAEYYLTHQDMLLEALSRVVRYADKLKYDSLYLERVQFANQKFHIYPGKWEALNNVWRTTNKSADHLIVHGWDMLNRADIGERHYICLDIHNDLLQRAKAEGQSRLEKVTREKKRLQKERDEIEKRIARLEELEARYKARQAEKAEQKKHPRRGYVYLLNEVNGDHYKIGRTRNPDNRIRTFSVKLPYQVEYTHLIETDDMYTLEAELHARFDHCRVDGEWFALTPADVDYIKSL